MKPRFVSMVAMLICCAIIAFVGLFGYSRYRAAEAENAAFGAQLHITGKDLPGQESQGPLNAHMPEQLPPRTTSAAGESSASPQPGR